MKFIQTDWPIPYYNFALEEYLLTEAPLDSYLFFYIHKPAVIIGRHQNTLEEIDRTYTEEAGITIARRMSGGGAVYHDEGNLSFSFVKPGTASDVNDFSRFTEPITATLRSLGADAHLSGRNDLLIGERKISGNAQYFHNGRILSHGTLLFDTDMSKLGQALRVKPIKIASKGVQSVRSRVANIKEFLPEDFTIFDLREAIIDHFRQSSDVEEYVLAAAELAKINERADGHFASWDWNWGSSPKFELSRMDKFPCGIIDVRLTVRAGVIDDLKIYGDFFERRPVEELEDALRGASFHQAGLTIAVETLVLDDYFYGLDVATFVNFLLG